jgi:hypothetical protein
MAIGRARRAAAAAVVGALALSGCGKGDGPSDYEKMMQAKQGAADSLATSGAKVTEKQYPVGKGWVVDLRGVTVSDDLLRQVKQLGNVAELNLAKTNVTDDQMRLIHELDMQVLLTKLDLSHTAVTDAGLDQLDGNIFLTDLNLTGAKVSAEAVARFKQRRQADPKVRVKNTNVRR